MNVIPVVEDRNGKTKPLPTEGCDVHLIEADEQITQWIYPCGKWFQPPVGRYLFWLEQGSTVSFQSVLSYAGEPSTGSGLMLTKTLYPAGFVRLKKATKAPADATFRVISLERVENYRPYDRRIESKSADDSIRLPVGPMIAGFFDRHGRAVALSRPREVSAGGTTMIDPATPASDKTHVLAVFSRSGFPGPIPCGLTLMAGQRSIPPIVNFQTEERIVAGWYDLTSPADVRLSIACGDTQPFTRSLRLKAGAIETVRATLAKPLPPIQLPN